MFDTKIPWKCCPVCEQKLDGIIERQEYDRTYDIEKLKSDAKDLGYNIIPIKNKEKLLPCTCGCRRREHWSHYDAETGKFKEGLRCKQCGKEVWGDSESDAVRIWNETIRKEQNEQR